MLSLQEISDRLEIQQLIVDYASAIDSRDYAALDQVFAPDAYIDYRAMGGIDGDYPKIKAWFNEGVMARFPSFQHMVGNMDIKIAGDAAKGRIMCFNPIVLDLGEGKTQVGFFGLWYIDKYARTPNGWRVTERVEERSYIHNYPDA